MRRIAAVATTALLGAGVMLAGCGGSSDPAGTGTTATAVASSTATGGTGTAAGAQEAVSAAYTVLRAESYVSEGTTSQKIDASGLDASVRDEVQDQLSSEAADVATRTRVESPERMAIAQEVGGRSQQIVLYDGEVFVSPDGTTWARATGAAAKAFSQAAGIGKLDPASLFTDLVSAGAAEVNGQPATRYTGAVDTAATGSAIESLIGGLGALGSAVGDAVSLRSGTVEVLVDDASGAVARQDLSITLALDFDAIAKAAGEAQGGSLGSVLLTSAGSEVITRAGGDVTVTKPTATKTVSTVVALGEFLTS